jgi:ribosomal protein S18 acetylase RimI-like enzyme
MIALQPPLRRATPGDAAALADLVHFASEGLALHVWTKAAGPGGDPWQVGQERARRDKGSFSYRNAIVIEEAGRVVAGLVGYPLPDHSEPIDYGAVPPMFVPLEELEALAPGSWYVNVLAAYPEHRGRGHGSALLSLAEKCAAESGKTRLSIIVSDANRGARRLYERAGYREQDRRPMVKETWTNPGEDWVLLVKGLKR